MAGSEWTIPQGFRSVADGDVTLVVRETRAEPVLAALSPLHQAWERLAQRRFTAHGRGGVVSLPLGDGLPDMMVRRYRHGGVFGVFAGEWYLDSGRALRELIVSEKARCGGVRTPEAIGVMVRKTVGPFRRLAFLSSAVSDTEDLVHYCCRLSDYPAETEALEKRGVIREAARQIRAMHDLGIRHADLHLKNLLLRRLDAGTPEVYVIDFDNADLGPPLSPSERLRNLGRLARSVRKVRVADSLLTPWDRIRFLREYFHGAQDSKAELRRWAGKLAGSGKAHEVWWAATGARRNLRGDRVPRLSGSLQGKTRQ